MILLCFSQRRILLLEMHIKANIRSILAVSSSIITEMALCKVIKCSLVDFYLPFP